MHIMDGLLSPPVAAATSVVAVGGFAYALRKLERGLGERTTVLMGIMSAFVFAAQMVNFPVGPGVSGHLLGGVPLLASFANMLKLEGALALPPDAVRRLGALGVSVVEDAERLRERLRLSNAEYERLASMADGWWRVAGQRDEPAGRVLLYRLGRERFTDRVLLAWTRSPEGAAARRARRRRLG